jgi:MarR family transcriptional regulator, organic hydroperoxide resistance regulator
MTDAPGDAAASSHHRAEQAMNADAREQAAVAFRRAGRESSRLSVLFRSAIAAKLGLNVTDMECLDFLLDAGSASAGQIAQETNLTTGAITSMIRRLETAGYVTSQRDPADRRRVIVSLVPGKLERGEELYAPYRKDAEQIIADYSSDQLEFLARHYERMSALYLAQLTGLRAAQPPRGTVPA